MHMKKGTSRPCYTSLGSLMNLLFFLTALAKPKCERWQKTSSTGHTRTQTLPVPQPAHPPFWQRPRRPELCLNTWSNPGFSVTPGQKMYIPIKIRIKQKPKIIDFTTRMLFKTVFQLFKSDELDEIEVTQSRFSYMSLILEHLYFSKMPDIWSDNSRHRYYSKIIYIIKL